MQIASSRVWKWRVVLLALGAALLVPASGFAQSEQIQKQIEQLLVQQKTNAVQAADKEKLQAELKMLEETLQLKLREMQEMQAQMQKLSAKLKEAQVAPPAPGAKLVGPRELLFLSVGENKTADEIHLRKVGDKWEVVQPKPQMIEIRPGTMALPGKPASPQPEIHIEGVEMRLVPPAAPSPPGSRIDELEKKIDRALQQLEQMRREMKPGRTGAVWTREGAIETGTTRWRLDATPER